MNTDGKITLDFYSKAFLDASWKWLNDTEIKKLVSAGSFTKEQQLDFYSSLSSREDYRIWGLSFDGVPIGVVGLKGISGHSAEYFGYIGEKAYWNKGLSKNIFESLESKLEVMQINKIWLKVSNENLRAIAAYQKNKFEIVSSSSCELIMERYFEF
ncbi:GNAT family N-acetyltransferase [Shewanella algae]|uniref:30S ribosomal protein S5 alanine N-acetyltransferase n=1 Tax=Shewanella algae TaxID=38313 RepID=A0AAD1KAK2_9GAMM|nr:GNAT family protein [Shewanella algae]MBO2594658.1 GNAT family N-acetyltransferase [Shewanella algae]MBO2666014.1 GNAT family N-acetyltransferase [Shewanella algae]MBO2678683.1 GNAT family N-acetyltransferase [Shewanella algae]BCV44442.1 30S ribosomal protein S5 alanine N-acetyltransferase [Shewanella algae]